MDLSIPIPGKQVDPMSRFLSKAALNFNLTDCLEAFIQDEQMEKCGYKCQKCKSEDNFRNQMTIWRYPPILVIHLKRFVYNSTFKQKLNANVSVPLKLDMQPYAPYNPSNYSNVTIFRAASSL